jgi:hypothetical protein
VEDLMGGAYSRNKGARAERELCSLLTEYLGVEATRQYKQFAQAQHGDIEQLIGPYLVEVKNHATLKPREWWIRRGVRRMRVVAACRAWRTGCRIAGCMTAGGSWCRTSGIRATSGNWITGTRRTLG